VKNLGVFTRAFRNISRRKIRALLVVVALGFSMAIMISIPSGIMSNQTATQRLTENYNELITNMQEEINATLTLIECSPSSGFAFGPMPGGSESGSYLDESIVSYIESIQGVKDVVPLLEKSEGTSQTMERFGRTFTFLRPDYTIIGVPLNSSLIDNYSILPTNITEGRNLREGDSEVVLLSLNNTEYFGVEVGDTVNILGSDFTVVGVHGASGFREGMMLYMNISDAQKITDLEGKISRLDVYAEDQSYVDGIASTIESNYPELSATTASERLSQFQNMQAMSQNTLQNAEATISQTQTTAFQEIVIAVAATSLIVLFTMLYTVRERTKEIGILKAIGFSNWNVMSQFMFEGILLSLMAGVVGIAIGIVGAPVLSSLLLPHISMFGTQRGPGSFQGYTNPGAAGSQVATAALDPQLMLLAFGVAALLGALGSLYPAWRASRTSPMEALKYE
jgi:putative ABC transport system permease protein